MTVRINKKALNLREELTKAQGVVPYVQQQFWMDGLVENGTFDDDLTGWTVTATGTESATVSSGVLVFDRPIDGADPYIVNTGVLEAGRTYVISFDLIGMTDRSKNIGFFVGSSSFYANTLVSLATDGTKTFQFTPTSSGAFKVAHGGAGPSTIQLDNIAVFEVDENDEVIHSLPLGWKPLHVYEDGLIQREGDVHDYTVVKTGGAYAIKPAVQPTATTETCVIAEREL